MVQDTKVQSAVAIGSFLAAVAFAFAALIIHDDHRIIASDLMMVAQFLVLTATIFGLDYKISAIITRMKKEGKV